MVKILVWGTSGMCAKIEAIINYQLVEIIGYIDNDKLKVGLKNGKPVLQPQSLYKYDYEYIIIASSFYNDIINQMIKLGIDRKKVINVSKYLSDLTEIECANLRKRKLIKNYTYAINSNDIEAIITGLSYAEWGINTNLLKYNAVNCALSGQDLYYDYNIVKNILNLTKSKIKAVIIGLSYYSFQYDESMSTMNLRNIDIYKDILNLTHNYDKKIIKYENFIGDFQKISEFDGKLFESSRCSTKNTEVLMYNHWVNNFDLQDISEKIKKAQDTAAADSNKNYPRTVEENIQIMKKYLSILKRNNIRVFMVVFPVSKYYRQYFDVRLKNEFYSIINKLSMQYEFKLLDLFSTDKLNDDDFSDCSHLNLKGANKVTNLLNKFM